MLGDDVILNLHSKWAAIFSLELTSLTHALHIIVQTSNAQVALTVT